jgi:hypothetical protein
MEIIVHFDRFYVILKNLKSILKELKKFIKLLPINIPDIKIIQRISTKFRILHFNF